MSDKHPDVAGFCPACGGESLFLGSGGYVTCRRLDCLKPHAASAILDDREIEHIVTFRPRDFTVRHPLRERLEGELEDCALHRFVLALNGPPVQPGRYRMRLAEDGVPSWEALPAEHCDCCGHRYAGDHDPAKECPCATREGREGRA